MKVEKGRTEEGPLTLPGGGGGRGQGRDEQGTSLPYRIFELWLTFLSAWLTKLSNLNLLKSTFISSPL